jgi:hypothetical protein
MRAPHQWLMARQPVPVPSVRYRITLWEVAMRTLTTMVFILGLGMSAWAQQESAPGKVEASGVLGLTAFGSDYTRHTTVGGAADVRLLAGLRVGSEILYHIGPLDDRDMTLSLITSYDFKRSGRLTPFVIVSGGMLRRSYGRG